MEPDPTTLPGPQDEAGWVALLLEHAGNGTELDLVGYDEETDPEQADAWPVGRQVPAAAVRAALLQLQRDPDRADPRGLRLAGADIRGRLDLDHLQPPCRLRLGLCRLADGLTLDNARIPGLSLEGSRLNGHEDSYAVSAVGATITGQLALSGAELTNEGGIALALDGANIDGGAFLDDVTATGLVLAHGATIGGQLNMRSAELNNGDGIALYLAGASISGSALLDEGFSATGEVRANGATITGRFILSGAVLLNMNGTALNLDGASIGGDLLLDEVTATGEVRAHGATIGGQLIMRSAELIADGKTALHLDGADIGGGAFLDEGFSATGEVRALHATIAGLMNMRGAELTNEVGDALILDGASIGGDLFLDGGFTATGPVRAPGATIVGQLSLRGATLNNEGGDALYLGGASIGGGAFLDEGFTATGEVRANGATIKGNLCLRGAILTNEEGTKEDDAALHLDRASISGSALLDDVTATGEVRANGATITGQLELSGATLTNNVGTALNLDWARVEQLLLRGVAGVEGRVSLAGCQIGDLVLDEGTDEPPPGALVADGWQVRTLEGEIASDARLAQKWLDSLPAGVRYSPQPARALADVFDRAGHPDKARRLRYGAARRVAREAPRCAKPRHYMYGGLVGHGYYPLFTLGWLAVLFVFAAVLATTQADLFTPTDAGKAQEAATAVAASGPPAPDPLTGATACEALGGYPCFSPWSYALQTVVPPAAAVQTTAWQPAGWVLLPFTALKAAGWVLVALLLAGVTGILRRT